MSAGELLLSACFLGFVMAVVGGFGFMVWRASLPWDQRDRPLFPWRRPARRAAPATLRLDGFAQLHPQVPLELDLSGWTSTPRQTVARFVFDENELTTQKLDAPLDEGALAFTSPDGQVLIAEPLPERVTAEALARSGGAEVRSANVHLRLFQGSRGLLFVVSPHGALVIAAALDAPRVRQALTTLRPVGTKPAPARREERIELRVCNDGLLADVLERSAEKRVAFEVLAPNLNVLFIEKPHPDSTIIEPLSHDELQQLGGRDAFVARMAALLDPLTAPLQDLGNDVFTNARGDLLSATLIVQPQFFARLAATLGPALLVGVPSVTRVFVARDTPKHREVLSQMLDVSPGIETTTRLSTRVYRVTGEEWDEWSVVDAKH